MIIPIIVTSVLLILCGYYYEKSKMLEACMEETMKTLDEMGELQHFMQVVHEQIEKEGNE